MGFQDLFPSGGRMRSRFRADRRVALRNRSTPQCCSKKKKKKKKKKKRGGKRPLKKKKKH
eukprot:NODE_22617_length_701_cov_2.689895.p4 GENE.NODE_22617_length_701_cov_2.689895~~NODE_22617_length_701_cov_2.689895.p4  ORF type:complete len:60 (-),score=32.67 NODE_22617_length_701_cov_2.689895:129-308(-)